MITPRTLLSLGSSGLLLGGTGVAALASIGASPVSASVDLTVTDLSDGAAVASDCTTPVAGACSVRDALAASVSGDRIVFDPTLFTPGTMSTITLTQGALSVDAGRTVVGPGADLLAIDGHDTFRALYTPWGAQGDVAISDITLANGQSQGGIGGNAYFGNIGDVTLQRVEVSGGRAENGGWNRGGGIFFYNSGDVTIIDSTFTDNYALGNGGAITLGNKAATTIANSTFAGNSSGGAASAIELYHSTSVEITFSTVVDNDAGLDPNSSYGRNGAVAFVFDSNFGQAHTTTITGSIISDNTAPTMSLADLAVSPTASWSPSLTLTNSAVGTSPSSITTYTDGGGNLLGATLALGLLTDNGGPTRTIAPQAGSPLIDAGPSTWTPFAGDTSDQRGTGYDRVVNGTSDIGAVEVAATPPPSSTTSTTSTTSSSTTSTTTTTIDPVTTTTTAGEDPIVPAFTG